MNRNPFEIAFDNVLAGAAYASQSSDSASVKEQHMDNVNHPKHYENGPFECIELSRLLSSDWGQAVQYCFRWQHKNGVEDLKKALWFVNDALVHGIPIYAVSDWADLASALFHTLAREDWAGLKSVWDAFTVWHRGDIPGLLKDKINEIEKEGK